MSKTTTEAEMVVLPLEIKAIIAYRATTVEEWGNRNQEASRLPIGSVVVEVDKEFTPQLLAQLDIHTLIASGYAAAYLVKGYAKADGRPLCQLIGRDSGIADLPLLPVLLSELPLTTKR